MAEQKPPANFTDKLRQPAQQPSPPRASQQPTQPTSPTQRPGQPASPSQRPGQSPGQPTQLPAEEQLRRDRERREHEDKEREDRERKERERRGQASQLGEGEHDKEHENESEDERKKRLEEELEERKKDDETRREEAERRARDNAEDSQRRLDANRDAQEKEARGERQESTKSPSGDQPTSPIIVTTISEHPEDQKIGIVHPSTTRLGASDANPRIVSDPAAESSTLSHVMMDAPLSRGPSPQDFIPTDEDLDNEIEIAKTSTGQEEEVRYYFSNYPDFSLQAGRRGEVRTRFQGRVLATSDPIVIQHIEENHLNKGTRFRIEEIDEGRYREERTKGHTVPIIRRMADPRTSEQVFEVGAQALSARAARTEQFPYVMEPEIGTGQVDHFTQAELLIESEPHEDAEGAEGSEGRGVRGQRRIGNIQLRRNQQELEGAAGMKGSVDVYANVPPPQRQR